MEPQKLTCIVCPRGCQLTVSKISDEFNVEGNRCKRGIDYGIKEVVNPVRKITSTVKVKNAMYSRLPVISDQEISKGLMFEVMKELNKVELTAPVNYGDIVIENVLNTGVNIVASRSLSNK
jgi:CxxC motif-containing protein